MKRIAILATVIVVVALAASEVKGLLTPISPAPPGELNLLGTGGILDTVYGLGNLVRISDSFIGDQFWGLTGGET
jgi:hypothetical protein